MSAPAGMDRNPVIVPSSDAVGLIAHVGFGTFSRDLSDFPFS